MNPWELLGGTPHDYFISATTTTGILLMAWNSYVQHRQWRDAVARPAPVFEVVRQADTPWTGWDSIQIVVRNPGPSTLVLTCVRFRRFARARLVRRAEIATDDGYTSDALPVVPPAMVGKRSAPFNMLVPPGQDDNPGTQRLTLFARRTAAAGSRTQSLTLQWHWLDQPNRILNHKICA